MSKSREVLSLLRTATRVSSVRVPHRYFATALQAPGTQQISNYPSYPYRSSTDHAGPGSIATTSAITLDHPFWSPQPSASESALAYATDDELFHALLRPASGALGEGKGRQAGKIKVDKWISTVDPASAFLALRSRPTYTAFLQCIHQFLSGVYPRLKGAGQHQLLVSDLLLRHPDPRLLRDALEMDARDRPSVIAAHGPARAKVAVQSSLRSSLVASIHSIIGWQIRRGSLARLDYRTNLAICRAHLEQEDTSALLATWHDLRSSLPAASKETTYNLLAFAVNVSRTEPVHAFSMLHFLTKDGILPKGILLRGLGTHSRRRQILIMAAAVDSCLRWRMDERARLHAEQLLDLVYQDGDAEGGVAQVRPAMELLFKVLRLSVVVGQPEEMSWCRYMLAKIGRMISGDAEDVLPGLGALRDMLQPSSAAPVKVPDAADDLAAQGPLVDAVIDAERLDPTPKRPPDPSLGLTSRDMWRAVPVSARPTLSAQSLLYLAQQSDSSEERVEHIRAIAQLDPVATVALADPLLALVIREADTFRAQQDSMLSILLRHWAGSANIGSPFAFIQLVRNTRADKPRCLALMRTYEARLFAEYSRRGEASTSDKLAMVQGFLLLKERRSAEMWFDELNMREEEVRRELWKMSTGVAVVRIGLRQLLRGIMDPVEVNKLLAGAEFGPTEGQAGQSK